MKRAAGLGKGLFSANQRGSVCPCGEIIGRSRTVSYNFTATARAVASAGNSRFASSMGPFTPLTLVLYWLALCVVLASPHLGVVRGLRPGERPLPMLRSTHRLNYLLPEIV